MSKELEALKTIKSFREGFVQTNEWTNALNTIEQAITPTPLDQLRDEIIEELSELFNNKITFHQNFFSLEYEHKNLVDGVHKLRKIYASYTPTKLYINEHIPIKLARKICEYFYRLESSDENL